MRLFMWIALGAAAMLPGQNLPWYMQETAMTPDGRLTFLGKPWWPKAQALAEGQSFTLDLNKDGRPETMVVRRNGHIVQAIDDTGRAANIWNEASTAYLVSHKGTGVVDRMIAYIDNDGDGKADEMELRHYQDGYLRYSWFGENFDPDGARIFDINNDWSYVGNNGKSKFRGNLQIFLNKYDPSTKTWVPLSECPFSFWDYDGDGHGDITLRVSAAPLASIKGADTDYANNYKYMWAPEATPLEETGNVNTRFSFSVDPAPRRDPLDKPHYNFGFTMSGAVPYKYAGMTYTNPRRRPPQTVTRIDWKRGVEAGMTYPATETAFTWDESRSVWRWEGQFWIYERIYIPNTGGPTHRWNMRREYSPEPSTTRRLYYSEADKRYHLEGAAEGWLEAGHLANQSKDLEFRWFDKDGDGRLDTVQVFRPDNPAPVRESRFDPRARPVALDRDAIAKEYNGTVLPAAIEENRRFLAAIKSFGADPQAEVWVTEAEKSEAAERRRYCLDIARELAFLKVRDALWARLASGPYPAGPLDRTRQRSHTPGQNGAYSLYDTLQYQKLARQIQQFIDQYAAGRLDEAAKTVAQIGQ